MNGITITTQPAKAATAASVEKVVVFAREQINEWCTEKHTRAVAWCLYIFADCPRMEVPEICAWLDEIGAATPKMQSWNDCYRADQNKIEKTISEQRANLRKRGVPYNH